MTENNVEGQKVGNLTPSITGHPKRWNRFNKIISHPFILIIIAAILSAWLLPWINFKSERRRVLYERRLNKAIEIVNYNKEVTSRLNALQTALELFHKDNLDTDSSAERLEEEKKKLREKMNMLYLEFDNKAWFWYWALIQNAKIIGVFSEEEIDYLMIQMNTYEDNLVKSLEFLRKFWVECLKVEYEPSDPTILKLMKQTRQMLHNMAEERNKLIGLVVKIICSKD